jgi:hypothetical protein
MEPTRGAWGHPVLWRVDFIADNPDKLLMKVPFIRL